MKRPSILALLLVTALVFSGCVEPEQPPDEPVVEAIECGKTAIIAEKLLTEITGEELEADTAFGCMGQALIENCTPAKATVDTIQDSNGIFEIMGMQGAFCQIRIGYGPEDGLKMDSLKEFANQYADCPVDLNLLRAGMGESANENRSQFAATVYTTASIAAIMPNICTGALAGNLEDINATQPDLNVTGPDTNATPDLNAEPDTNQTGDQNAIDPDAGLTKNEKIARCHEKTVVEESTCLRILALNEKDPDVCYELNLLVDDCIKDVAVAADNSLVCQRIETTSIKTSCLSELGTLADENATCAGLDTNVSAKDSCYTGLASTENDYTICGLVSGSYRSGSYARDECFTDVLASNKLGVICPLFIDANIQQQCYLEIAQENIDLNLCNKLTEVPDLNTCINEVAPYIDNATECEYIENNDYQQQCYVLAAETFLNSTICEKITNTGSRNICYKNAAEENLEPETCAKITKLILLEDCYMNVAIDSNNSTICEGIRQNVVEWDECYSTIAISRNDYALCENVRLGKNYLPCFIDIAIALNAPEVCLTMQEDRFTNYSKYPTKDLCYKDVGIELELDSLCTQIADANLTQACVDGDLNFH